MSVFVDKDAEILVNLFVYKNAKGKVFAWTKNLEINKPEVLEEDASIDEYEIRFRLPTYKDILILMEKYIRIDEDGKSINIMPTMMAYDRFALLLKSWNFKDQNGDLVPENRKNLDSLLIQVAQAITMDLESQLEDR